MPAIPAAAAGPDQRHPDAAPSGGAGIHLTLPAQVVIGCTGLALLLATVLVVLQERHDAVSKSSDDLADLLLFDDGSSTRGPLPASLKAWLLMIPFKCAAAVFYWSAALAFVYGVMQQISFWLFRGRSELSTECLQQTLGTQDCYVNASINRDFFAWRDKCDASSQVVLLACMGLATLSLWIALCYSIHALVLVAIYPKTCDLQARLRAIQQKACLASIMTWLAGVAVYLVYTRPRLVPHDGVSYYGSTLCPWDYSPSQSISYDTSRCPRSASGKIASVAITVTSEQAGACKHVSLWENMKSGCERHGRHVQCCVSIDAFFPCGDNKWESRELGERFPDGVIALDLMMLDAQQALWDMFVFNFCHGSLEVLFSVSSGLAHFWMKFGIQTPLRLFRDSSGKSKAVALAGSLLVLLPVVRFSAQLVDKLYDVKCHPGDYEISPNLCRTCSTCFDIATCVGCKNVTRQAVSSVTVQLGHDTTGLMCAPHKPECNQAWAMALCNLLKANANSSVKIQRCPAGIVVLSLAGTGLEHFSSRRLLNGHDPSVVVFWYIRHQDTRSDERMSVVNAALAQPNASLLGLPVIASTRTTPRSIVAKLLAGTAPDTTTHWVQQGRRIAYVAGVTAGIVSIAIVLSHRACCSSMSVDTQLEDEGGRGSFALRVSSLDLGPSQSGTAFAAPLSGPGGNRRVPRRERSSSKPSIFD